MNSSSRALCHTFAAQLALGEINICEIVLHCDSIVRADFCAFAATYAGSLAGLSRHSTLVLVDAADEYTHSTRSFIAELDDIFRTSLGTRAAGGTEILVYDWQTCFRVHLDGSELAGSHAVTATETSE